MAPRMNPYRMRILGAMRDLTEKLGPIDSALDFGSGDGFFASQWRAQGNVKSVTPVDVVERKTALVAPTLYDGRRLPFDDRSFTLGYSIDVLHHCPDPVAALFDLARCTRKYLLIKDHTYRSWLGKWTLAVLDELGNRRFGIPSPYLYQRHWTWVDQLEAQGWRRLSLTHPMACHAGLLGAATNSLQFIGLWSREGV
jgi:SAM-dependent methyltransferase